MDSTNVLITFQAEDPLLPDEQELEENISRLAAWLIHDKSVEISLLITDDDTIRKINKEKRGKDKATDVLSFPYTAPDLNLPCIHLGEIVISADTAKIQAGEIGHSVREEFYRLLVHGFLHLLGYDHETGPRDEKIMKAREDECLAMLLDNECPS